MRGSSNYRVSRKMMLMMTLLAIGMWRAVGLIERMSEAAPGGALVEAGAGERLLRDGLLDLTVMRPERGPDSLRNGFSMRGGGAAGAASEGAGSDGPGSAGGEEASPLGGLMGMLGLGGEEPGGEGAGEPPPPKATSIVRVRTKGEG